MTQKIPYQTIGFLFLVLFSIPLAYVSSKALSFLPIVISLFLTGHLHQHTMIKQLSWFRNRLFVYCSLFLALAFLSYFWAIDGANSLQRAVKLSFLFLGGYLLIQTLTTVDHTRYQKALNLLPIITLFFIALVCLDLLFFNGLIYYTLHFKEFDHPKPTLTLNWIVLILTCFIWPVMALTWQQGRKPLTVILLAAAGLMVVISESQSALLGFITGLFIAGIAFLLKDKRSILRRLASFGLLLVLILSPVLISKTGPIGVISQQETTSTWLKNSSAIGRLDIWRFVTSHIEHKPLHGWGLDSTRSLTIPQDGFFKEQRWHRAMHPHNAILQIWVDLGVIGILLTFSFLLYLIREIERLRPTAYIAAWGLFTAVFTISTVGYSLWQGWWLGTLFLATGMIITASRCQSAPSS